MGFLADIMAETRREEYEKEVKHAYQLGFQDGRLCPAELRPCEVAGRPGLFHRFADSDRALLSINSFVNEQESEAILEYFRQQLVTRPGASAEILRKTYAIVEYDDGSVELVEPENVRFTDREGAKA
jgi:hypothetical protein